MIDFGHHKNKTDNKALLDYTIKESGKACVWPNPYLNAGLLGEGLAMGGLSPLAQTGKLDF